ncbi:hypothetical protein HDU76_002257 [Blyttiomyces sp. JEL0837]|nr:hypothetical protein HDU76_002257 [Blyttiomyces sp. JEL0837]
MNHLQGKTDKNNYPAFPIMNMAGVPRSAPLPPSETANLIRSFLGSSEGQRSHRQANANMLKSWNIPITHENCEAMVQITLWVGLKHAEGKPRDKADIYKNIFTRYPSASFLFFFSLCKFEECFFMVGHELGHEVPKDRVLIDADEDDIVFLKGVEKDPSMQSLVRIQAAFLLGNLLWKRGDAQGAARRFRKAIEYEKGMTKEERSSKVMYSYEMVDTTDVVSDLMENVENMLETAEGGERRKEFHSIYDSLGVDVIPGPNAVVDVRQIKPFKHFATSDENGASCVLLHHIRPGAEDLDFYQIQQRAGVIHGGMVPFEFKKGDIVKLKGVVEFPQINGFIVSVLGPGDAGNEVRDKDTLWMVDFLAGGLICDGGKVKVKGGEIEMVMTVEERNRHK